MVTVAGLKITHGTGSNHGRHNSDSQDRTVVSTGRSHRDEISHTVPVDALWGKQVDLCPSDLWAMVTSSLFLAFPTSDSGHETQSLTLSLQDDTTLSQGQDWIGPHVLPPNSTLFAN